MSEKGDIPFVHFECKRCKTPFYTFLHFKRRPFGTASFNV